MQVKLSIRDVTGLSKPNRATIKHYSRFIACEFTDLANMLVKDYIYSPFNYIGYTQSTYNICSNANFVVIDVDYTSVSIHERLSNLIAEDLQCIIGTTSNTDDLYKYRVLILIDRPVSAEEYRYLVQGIQSNKLIEDLDIVSSRPAQKFYSYADSIVISNLTGSQLIVDDYLVIPNKPMTIHIDSTVDVTSLLPEFNSYRHATKGSRTRSLLSAAYKCLEYGMNDKQLEQVLLYVNSLFLFPKSHDDIHRRVVNFIKTQRRNT